MLRSLENLKFIKSDADRLEVQMCTQGKMIEMPFDLQTFQLEKGIQHGKDMIVLRHDSAHRRFAQSSILFERFMGKDSAARPFLEEAQSLFKQYYQPYFHIFTIVHLGNVELGLGNPEKALVWQEQAYAEAQSIHENWRLSFALNNLGEVARTQGRCELARKYYEECEVLLRDTGDMGNMARFVHSLGYIAQHEGDYARAESQFRKSLRMFRRLGNRRGIAECMAGLAGLKARQGNAEWGAIMLSAAESVLKSTGGAWWPADRIEVDRDRQLIRSALSEDELEKARKQGESMTIDQAIRFASDES